MSLQYLLEAPEQSSHGSCKVALTESLKSMLAIRSRSSSPDNDKFYSDDHSDKGSTADSLALNTRTTSSSSSMNSIDFSQGSLFEIDVCPKRKKFVNPEDRRQFVEEYKRKYKTEMCKNWELRGTCKFGDKCCFAHGRSELKAKILTHVKYKTKPCKQYHQTGYCPYGQRCQYLHKEAIQPNIFCNPAEAHTKTDNQIYEVLHEVNRLCNTEADLNTILEKLPKRPRLSVFQSIAISA